MEIKGVWPQGKAENDHLSVRQASPKAKQAREEGTIFNIVAWAIKFFNKTSQPLAYLCMDLGSVIYSKNSVLCFALAQEYPPVVELVDAEAQSLVRGCSPAECPTSMRGPLRIVHLSYSPWRRA